MESPPTITFNRPNRLNAFRVGMYEEILDAVLRAGWARDVGVIVLQGAGGKSFGVGGICRTLRQNAVVAAR
jgi:2-ketocyclohexanecarboxyl-CoA hydrolase